MPQTVEVPEKGAVEFPDGMSKLDIEEAIYQKWPDIAEKSGERPKLLKARRDAQKELLPKIVPALADSASEIVRLVSEANPLTFFPRLGYEVERSLGLVDAESENPISANKPILTPEQARKMIDGVTGSTVETGSFTEGAKQYASELISGMSSPNNAAALFVGAGGPKVAKAAMAGLFGGQAAADIPEAIQEVAGAQTPEEAGKGLVRTAIDVALPVGVAVGAAKGAKTESLVTPEKAAVLPMAAVELKKDVTKTPEPEIKTPEVGRTLGKSETIAPVPETIAPKTETVEAKPTEKVSPSGEVHLTLVPGLKEFVEKDVIPAVSKGIEGVVKMAKEIRQALSPTSMSAEAKQTAGVIRDYNAELARKTEVAYTELDKAKKVFDKVPPASNLQVMDRIERGQSQPTPQLQGFANQMRSMFDERLAQVRALGTGKLQRAVQDYFPHLWKDPDAAASLYAKIFGKRPLRGPASFLRQRKIPTIADGIAAGLEPVSNNPVELSLLKLREMDRYVMGQKVISELKDVGIAKFIRAGKKAPDGYTKINDRVAEVIQYRQLPGGGVERIIRGHYYAPEDAARVLNNFLSPGLRGKAWYDALRGAGNTLNQAQLGFSAYHLTFTGIDSTVSKLALAIKQATQGKVGQSAVNVGKGLVPLYAPIENFIRGSKVLKEYQKAGSSGGDYARIVDELQKGGGRVKMDSFWQGSSSAATFWKAAKEGNYPGALLRAPFAALDYASKPIMEHLVPRMKLGIFADLARYEMSKVPGRLTTEQSRDIMGKAWNSVDNRMGQMVYDNLFWDKTLKDLSMASVRSVGWNLGTFRELGGGLADTARIVGRLKRGEPLMTDRMAYTAALPIIVGLYGAMYQYLSTGKGPDKLDEYFMPKTGGTNPDGTPSRVMLPTYIKDIAPLVVAKRNKGWAGAASRAGSMAVHKAQPLISMTAEMMENKDFYGTEIRNADDPLIKQMKDEAEFIAKQFVSFSARNLMQRPEENTPRKVAESIAGILPANKELQQTPAMAKMLDYAIAKMPRGARPKDQLEAGKFRAKLLQEARQGKDIDAKVDAELDAGRLKPAQAKRIFSEAQQDPRVVMFKKLTLPESEKVYDLGSKEEKALWLDLLEQKRNRQQR